MQEPQERPHLQGLDGRAGPGQGSDGVSRRGGYSGHSSKQHETRRWPPVLYNAECAAIDSGYVLQVAVRSLPIPPPTPHHPSSAPPLQGTHLQCFFRTWQYSPDFSRVGDATGSAPPLAL